MKKIYGLLALVSLVCIGCAVDRTPIYYTSTFNKAQAERLLGPGKNRIIANDYIIHKHEDGSREIQTCAGGTIMLMPATERAAEYINILFGSRSWISNSRTGYIHDRIANEDPDFRLFIRGARCDSDGYAVFDNVADGEFYVLSQLSNNYSVQKVGVKDGQTVKVVLY